MSYCRWSSMDFGCDLYCYHDVAGYYSIWVAGNRVKGEVPPLRDWNSCSSEEFMEAYRKQMKFLQTAEHEPIDLPHAGEHFCEPDLESFLERLLYLRELGYRFPDHVIEDVKAEIKATGRVEAERNVLKLEDAHDVGDPLRNGKD